MEYFVGQIVSFRMDGDGSQNYTNWYKTVCEKHMFGTITSKHRMHSAKFQYGITLCKPYRTKEAYLVNRFSVSGQNIIDSLLYREV